MAFRFTSYYLKFLQTSDFKIEAIELYRKCGRNNKTTAKNKNKFAWEIEQR